MTSVVGGVRRHWFLVALAAVLAVGMGMGPTLAPLAEVFPRRGLIAAILFVTALPVDLRRMAAANGTVRAILLATLLNAIVAPPFGYAASLFVPTSLGIGLFVAAASPCTMASAAVWTRRGGGNDAVALAVTLLTSLGCFAVLPGWSSLLLGEAVGVEPRKLMVTLLACVALPVAVAQLSRRAVVVATFAASRKSALSLAGQIGILGIVLLGAIGAGSELRQLDEPLSAGAWLAVGGLAMVLHTTLLLLGWWGAKRAGLGRSEAIAVAIAGSQKTLAVGVGVASEFSPLALLPMIAYHVAQLVIDTLFVDRQGPGGPAPKSS